MADEQNLWKRITDGDAAAFDRFYRENAQSLCRFFRHIVSSLSVAEDLTQETFVEIWKRPYGFDSERGSLRAYLFGVARKRASEWWRTQKPTEVLDEASQVGDSIEAASVMKDAFRRLQKEQCMLLWLREVEGQSYSELAVIFDIPVGTVRSRLFAAREALRNIWNGTRPREEITEGVSHDLR